MSVRNPGMSACFAVLGASLLAVAGTAEAGWSGTASKAYTLQNASDLGAVPDSAPMHIVVGLRLQNEAELDDFIQRSHTLGDREYGTTLSADETVARFSPSARQAQTVTAYLQRAGLSNISVTANRMLVIADGSPSRVEAAFNTKVRRYRYGTRTVFANVADAQVPDTLNGLVSSVLGLQNADHPDVLVAYPDAVSTASVAPQDPVAFQSIYDALGIATGSATNLGIIVSGDLRQTVADLTTFVSRNHLPALQVVFQPSEVTSKDTSGMDEWNLDSQTVVGMAQSLSHLYFYNAASLNDPDLTVAYNAVVSDNIVKSVNVSLGICERSSHDDGSMAADDAIFKMAAAQGQTFFVSSGDGGANTGCFGQQGLFQQVGYPASSPYVVAVGGTTLTTSGAHYVSETAWSGSGGGVSIYESAPSWQKAVTGSSFRQVPDVAMDANPNSGSLIMMQGIVLPVGGTSLAAPLSAGFWARVQSAHGNGLSFAAPLIYAAAGNHAAAAFHDITSGSNAAGLLGLFGVGGYKAKVGYDEVTGLGSFDVGKFSAAVGP